jgi:polysaccharide biosynthesis/export protein
MQVLLLVGLLAATPATTAAVVSRPRPAPTVAPVPTAMPAVPEARSTPAVSDEYRVGAGDVLDIVVMNDAQFSRPAAVVQTNGMITIPLVGDVPVASLTLPEVRVKLTRLLDGFLVRPQVEVKVREYVSQYVTLMGEVNSPGKKPLRGPSKLLDVLTEGGGLRTTASGEIEISRTDGAFSGGEKLVRVHVGRNSPTAQDLINLQIPLRHLDMVRALPKYYVSIEGEVARPARYLLEQDLTVTGLISMAGGLTKWAKNDVKIIRRVDGSPQAVRVIEINVKDVRRGKKPDVPLEANDFVTVGRKLF